MGGDDVDLLPKHGLTVRSFPNPFLRQRGIMGTVKSVFLDLVQSHQSFRSARYPKVLIQAWQKMYRTEI